MQLVPTLAKRNDSERAGNVRANKRAVVAAPQEN